MKRFSIFFLGLSFSLGLSFLDLQAQSSSSWKGLFLFGYRHVNSSGTEAKYKEDLNLEKGARLFNFSLSYEPQGNGSKIIDRLAITLQNFGGDPFETLNLQVAKIGRFSFDYNRKKATYYYQDWHQSNGSLYDPYTFDFDRSSDSGQFRLSLSRQLKLTVSYERFGRKGKSTPPLDINRVEFEMEQPIEEDSKLGSITLNFHTRPFSLLLEEKIHDFKTTNSLFLPGYADGGPSSPYPSSLNYFSLNQPYRFRSYTHGLQFNLRPSSSLLLTGRAQLINLDLELDYQEKASGVDYLGWLFLYELNGQGKYRRDWRLYDFNTSYLLFNRLSFVANFRYHHLDQTGEMIIEGNKESSHFGYNTMGLETGLQILFSSRLNLTLGYRHEQRKLEGLETATYEDKTSQRGLFSHLRFEPSKVFRLNFDYQRTDLDEPFTLISPTLANRFKLNTQLRLKNFELSSSFQIDRRESEVFEDKWKSNRDQASLRLGYRSGKFSLSAGSTLINVKSRSDRSIAYRPFWTGPAGTFPWLIRYEGKSSLIDLILSFEPQSDLKLEAIIGQYTNRGFWPIDRLMAKIMAEYYLPLGFIVRAVYRYWDFKEKKSGFNDYKASIFEFSLGARFD
ncbi:MAG: hypothetical protein N3B16_04230 [Candidatus Aminicenantes bacterium]|nr:hypothetical protein [Candidatus Aminicenantes bacterium]